MIQKLFTPQVRAALIALILALAGAVAEYLTGIVEVMAP